MHDVCGAVMGLNKMCVCVFAILWQGVEEKLSKSSSNTCSVKIKVELMQEQNEFSLLERMEAGITV